MDFIFGVACTLVVVVAFGSYLRKKGFDKIQESEEDYKNLTVELMHERNSIESNLVGELQQMNKTMREYLDMHKKRSW